MEVESDRLNTVVSYKMQNTPRLYNKTIEDLDVKHLDMIPLQHNYFEYFLSKNSYVQLHFTLGSNITFAIVQGVSQFRDWLEDKTTKAGVKKQFVTSLVEKYEFRVTLIRSFGKT